MPSHESHINSNSTLVKEKKSYCSQQGKERKQITVMSILQFYVPSPSGCA